MSLPGANLESPFSSERGFTDFSSVGFQRPENSGRMSDPVQEAFENAVKLFREKLTHDECKRIWLDDKTSIQQIRDAVLSAQRAYENKTSEHKTMIWLRRLASRIVFYSPVLDVLASSKPEYTAFIWGSIRFFMQVRQRKILPAREDLTCNPGSRQSRRTARPHCQSPVSNWRCPSSIGTKSIII